MNDEFVNIDPGDKSFESDRCVSDPEESRIDPKVAEIKIEMEELEEMISLLGEGGGPEYSHLLR